MAFHVPANNKDDYVHMYGCHFLGLYCYNYYCDLNCLSLCLFCNTQCERIKKKRTSLIGSLRLAHDLSIDEVDQKILGARFVFFSVMF